MSMKVAGSPKVRNFERRTTLIPQVGKRVIFFVENQGGACTRYRALLPVQALNERGWFSRTSFKWEAPMINEFDLFVFQRTNVSQGVNLIESLRRSGKVTVYDIDDDLLHIPATSPVFPLILEHPDMIGCQMLALAHASALTVTTAVLADLYRGLNPNVYVLPNTVRKASWDSIPTWRFNPDPNAVILGWAGSNTHKDALTQIEPVLRTILNKYPQAYLVLMGDDLPFELDTSRYAVIPWGKYRLFQSVLKGFDIGLAPLGLSPFNQGKSNLRILELGCANKPVVATDWGEYATTITNGVDGFLCRTVDDWVNYLSQLIENATLRQTMADALTKTVYAQWELYGNIDQRIALYEQLLKSARPAVPEVTYRPDRLETRFPELGISQRADNS
jgi:glycosyltransferase involved in cell wall biosynthesis